MVTPSKLTPVSRFVAAFGMLPSSYKEAMTYEEQIIWLCNFLEKEVIPAINNNAEGLTELQNLYVELKDYVDNYFENLDVQEEINNKLDAMLEAGTLQEIITAYLQVKGLLVYNTKAEMKLATNLIDGSFAKTYGNTDYKDGDGYFYKIREITNQDVVDDDNIIALNDPDLVAEKIPYYYINDLQTQINTINDTDVMIILGDSWSDTQSSQTFIDRNVYPSIVANTLKCTLKNYAVHGAQVSHLGTQFEAAIADTSFNHDKVKYIIIEGGLNDLQHSLHYSSVVNAINGIIENMEDEFSNAKFYYIPNLNFPMTSANLGYIQQVENGIRNSKCSIIDTLKYLIGQKYFDSTPNSVVGSNNHLSTYGQEVFGRVIADFLAGGNYFEQVYKINLPDTNAFQGSGSSGTGELYISKPDTNSLNICIMLQNITGLSSGVNKFNIPLGESIISDIVQTTFVDDYGMFGNFSISSGILTLVVQKNTSNTNSKIRFSFTYPIGLAQSL